MKCIALLAALTISVAAPAAPAVAQGTSVRAAARLFDARDYAQARSELLAVTKAEPENAEAPYYLGRIAIVDGNAAEAVRWLERAVKLDPQVAAYHHWLGRAYSRQARRAGRFKQLSLAGKIRDAFQAAVALGPDDVEARRDLLQFYLVAPNFAGGSVSRAKAQAKAIAARSPMLGAVAAGWIAEKQKDNAGAERQYKAAVAQFPDSAAPYLALGALYQRTKEWDKAFDVYERLIAAQPEESEAYYQLGRVASQAGRNLERGEEALKTYLERKPGEGGAPLASAYYRLGLCYERRGLAAQAREQYAAALQLDPGEPDARAALKRLR